MDTLLRGRYFNSQSSDNGESMELHKADYIEVQVERRPSLQSPKVLIEAEESDEKGNHKYERQSI